MMTDAKGGLGVEGKQDERVMGRLGAQGNGSRARWKSRSTGLSIF